MGASNSSIKIMGLDVKVFSVFAIIVFALTYLGKLPTGMAGAVPLLLVIGSLFGLIGDRLPIIKDYFGGGPIVILFGSAALVLYQVLPKSAVETVTFFINKTGFLDFALATLITGSLFGTDRKTLLASCLRYVPCIAAAQIVGLICVALVGEAIGFGYKQAILYIGMPAMGGGITAGAIPMSKMFGDVMKQDPQVIFSSMVSAVAMANAMAILGGGIVHRLGIIKPSWTGNGKLLAVASDDNISEEEEKAGGPVDVKMYSAGILVSLCVLFAGFLAMKLTPMIHAYAYMVIFAVILKLTAVLPRSVEEAGYQWCQLCLKNFVLLLLAGLGMTMIDLNAVFNAFSLTYIVMVGTIVVSTAIAAALIGKLVGFNPIEAAITVGLCSTDMGGSGDLAILSAAKRMELLPFSAISTRLGGAMILALSGLLLQALL
ncbi:MAG: citS 2 [Anaerosporomusa subterranea]|jgi:Na+/citrate or Na+/malate symporter|nr:citS 2 [Anaerosporomusa subterranea]